MFRIKTGIIGLALLPLALGLLVGLAVPVDFLRDRIAESLEQTGASSHDHDHGASEASTGEADHIELTPTAQEAMRLKTGLIRYSDYLSSVELPAFVREIPGAGDLHISTRYEGMVKRVFISEGQTVSPGQPILEIELTGELLATAQAELLDAQKQISIVDQEIARLEPSVRSGGVASKKLIDVRYERDRLAAKVETKSQELLVRGISQPQIDEIIRTKNLLRTVTVRVPNHLIPPQLNAGDIMHDLAESFLVERLMARPGTITRLGESLCEISFHTVVVLEGQAYEKDLPRIRAAISRNQTLDVSIGPDGAEETISDQRIAFLSNHVDESTNTYPFYIYLKNEPLFETRFAGSDADFVSWKWKPGQRAHIWVPDKHFENQVVIPRDALAVDGLSHYVFRWNGVVEHDHDHDHDTDHDDVHDHDDDAGHSDHDHELLDEYQAIEVVVVHMDRRQVVIEKGQELQIGDRIAFNNADQLLFAMQAGSGGHAHHDHDH
jgi:multidrug efflux pump subunit AcrA (membrane-fusion protein)